jgi:hypothetical protein
MYTGPVDTGREGQLQAIGSPCGRNGRLSARLFLIRNISSHLSLAPRLFQIREATVLEVLDSFLQFTHTGRLRRAGVVKKSLPDRLNRDPLQRVNHDLRGETAKQEAT